VEFLEDLFAAPPPHRAQPRPNEPSRHGLFAKRQIGELVTTKSSRIRADDSGIVSREVRDHRSILRTVLVSAQRMITSQRAELPCKINGGHVTWTRLGLSSRGWLGGFHLCDSHA
jgi:hypothetical protein